MVMALHQRIILLKWERVASVLSCHFGPHIGFGRSGHFLTIQYHFHCPPFFFFLFFFFFFFAISWAAPMAHGGSQAGGLIGAVATSLRQRRSNAGFEPLLQATPKLTAMPDP